MTASRACLLAIVLAAAGCGNSSSYTPSITTVGDQQFGATVTTGDSKAFVEGIFFLPGMVVSWNGRALPTTVINGSQAQVQLDPALDTPIAGTATVSATNGDRTSAAASVTIRNGELGFTAVAPAQIAPGSAATTLSVIGSGFTPDTKVIWNDAQLDTTLVSGVLLHAQVPASLLAAAGEGIVQITSTPCTSAFFVGPCQPLTVSIGASTKSTLPGTFADIVADTANAQLLLATSNTVQALDPTTATFTSQSSVIGAPFQLALSDPDQFLYTLVRFVGGGLRLDLPGLSGAQTILPNESLGAIAAVPGTPGSLAFSNGGKTGIADGNTERTNSVQLAGASLAFGADASTLYVLDANFRTLAVAHADSSGVTSSTRLSQTDLRSVALFYDHTARLVYGNAGEVFDEQGNVNPLSSFAAANQRCSATAIDGALGKMFIACPEAAGLVVHSFDIATAQPIARVLLVASDAFESPSGITTPSKIVRWGTSGLAIIFTVPFASSVQAGVALYSGGFVQ
jgi:hypothetical protein